LIYLPVKYFCFDLPPNRPNKNENFLKKKIWFLFGLLGGKSKQKYFTGGKSKKIFYRGENQK